MTTDALPETAAPAQDLCACGSGLRAVRCCLQDATGTPEQIDAPAIAAAAKAALAALKNGALDEAERLSLELLDRAPDNADALSVLAKLRVDAGASTAALALLKRLVKAAPQNFWATNKLALAELARGNAVDAEAHARHAIRIAPGNPQAHNLMGMVMTELVRPSLGAFHCRKALALSDRRIPLVLTNLATNLTQLGQIDAARALYKEARATEPGLRQTLIGWARMEEADRKLDAACALLDQVEALGPPGAAVTLLRATILGRQKKYDAALTLLGDISVERNLLPMERLERGRLLDKMGRYDEAWADFDAAKADLRTLTGKRYNEGETAADVQRLREFFHRERLDLLPRAAPRTDVAQPVFILGFPRSGTTLIEQTLTASPTIAAGDELTLIHEIAAIAPRLLNSPWDYPGALAELWMGDQSDGLDRLRDYYLQRVAQLDIVGTATMFTDKMPLNETHLGLIGLLFPKAPLVHVVRHPLDIMVSAMSNVFTHGAFCGTALESAATHLALTSDLVEHYRREMDLNYMAVRYEDVVDDQEATMRRVFAFIGVTFDAAVLNFESNKRYARTASYAQVSEKLYNRSRYRYRHYRRHLEPAVPILRPLIKRLGYSVEDAL